MISRRRFLEVGGCGRGAAASSSADRRQLFRKADDSSLPPSLAQLEIA